MAITSQVRPGTTVGGAVLQHWKSAGLIKPFVLNPLLATVEHRFILRKMGTLHDDDVVALRKALGEIFGSSPSPRRHAGRQGERTIVVEPGQVLCPVQRVG